MCTLTFFPTSSGYIFTHNRDESSSREAALAPQWNEHKGMRILFPKDGRAGGTWIACMDKRSACLLNGAFAKHQYQPPYRLSRGIVLLDIFQFSNLEEFYHQYDLNGIEPFTVVHTEAGFNPTELRWDGSKKYFAVKENSPALWSSATLYNPEAQKKRQKIFTAFCNTHPAASEESIFSFHHIGKVGDSELDLVMERASGVKTLSISQIVCEEKGLRFRYHDMISGNASHMEI